MPSAVDIDVDIAEKDPSPSQRIESKIKLEIKEEADDLNETDPVTQVTSPFTIHPLKVTDLEESSVDENRIGNRRRDSSDHLFEIVPHCCIRDQRSNPGDGGRNPPFRLLSTAGGGAETLGIVLDSELLILEKDQFLASEQGQGQGHETNTQGQNKGQCQASKTHCPRPRRVQFPANIDFILWRRSIILIGLSSSEIVLLDPNTWQIKESKKVSGAGGGEKGRFFVDASIHSNPDPSRIDVTAVGVDGVIYSFLNISLSDGSLDNTQDQNISLDIDLGSVKGTRIKCLEKEGAEVICASSPSRNVIILGEVDGTLSLHDVEHLAGLRKEIHASQSVNIIQDLDSGRETGTKSGVFLKKVVAFEGLLFILLSDGRLEIYLNDVLFRTQPLQLPEHNGFAEDLDLIVHDFALLLNGEGEVKLWALYGTRNFSRNYLGIFGTPSFIPEFGVKIPKLVNHGTISDLVFPSQATPLEEPFAFCQVSHPEGGGRGREVTVFRMLETSTEATIAKLLARAKFSQAAELAGHYGKDLDIVYKAQARFKFNELQSLVGKGGSVFEELIQTLEKIREPTFICDFCAQEGFSSLDWIRRLLAVGKSRVIACSDSPSGKNLLLTVKKLYTFEQVFPSGGMQEWLAFVSSENTMFQQCRWFLDELEFAKCEKVWRRHFDEFIPLLKLDDFGPFLFVLFSQRLSSPGAVSLFQCILPFAVEKCAETGSGLDISTTSSEIANISSSSDLFLNPFQLGKVDLLVNIVKRQICSLERGRSWPDEAVNFSKIVIKIVKSVMDGLGGGGGGGRVQTQILICSEILDRMETLVQNLVELANLRSHHFIRIPFLQYLDGDVIEVVNSMMCELMEKPEIERFITNFLMPFAARKDIQIDQLYYKHIEAVVSDLPFHINPIDVPEEARLICLISHISQIDVKLRAVLKIAEEWPVPWSPNIDALVVAVLKIEIPKEDELCVQMQHTISIMRIQVPFRVLLYKHRLTATKVQNYCGVVMALTRIIKTGRPDYYEDCLEFIKHTGFVDEDKIKSIEFGLKLRKDVDIDELVMASWDRTLLKRLLARTMQEFRMGHLDIYTPTELERIIGVGKILANILDDRKALEFLRLRDLIPTLSDPDLVHDENYPFCILNHVMPLYYHKSTLELVTICRRICTITFSHMPDLLSAAAAFYTRPGATAPELEKVWVLIEKITTTPGASLGKGSLLVHSSAVTVAQFLLSHAPSCSEARIKILSDFLTILAEYDKSIEEISKMMGVLRIFLALREQEIPLEKEYLQIYLWLFVDGIPSEGTLSKALFTLGGTILKFGDRNLFKSVFGSVVKEFYSRIGSTSSQEVKGSIKKLVKMVKEIQGELGRCADKLAEPETNREVIKLVESLKSQADLNLTPYALRKRDKSRFLDKLLTSNHFSLAARTALVFQVYSDSGSWSRILQGFMGAGDLGALKKVLLELRNVSQLWILPQFAEGWKMVAERDPSFLDLCPIPLD